MNKKQYKVVGVMSGTSLDGVDLAECFFEISNSGNWSFTMGKATTIPYPESWKMRLQEGIHFSKGRLQSLNKEYTQYLGRLIKDFMTENEIEDVDAVCSHGHTILHQPEKGITLQIGNLPEISKYAEAKLICDFRVQDVALGGQGAPLVPIGDRLLFQEYDYCLNLGGFANVSSEVNGVRIAYDICPVNIVLNPLAEQMGYPFDKGGKLAASGSLDASLFQALNGLAFYNQSPPKSLGLEWVQKEVFPLLKISKASIQDQLHTVTEHIAFQLSNAFSEGARVLVTGGGAYNTYLLERVRHYTHVNLVVPEAALVEYKEALIFALLGVCRLRSEVNCLASVTGASRDHCSGMIFE
ncbi:anhydro-N-acetylmuramic acid kinase [Aureisphaera galaxeae]|uniref:anhydro-N-acetylmuramic acid kinase n=1 Tax=Aureisphaera galaxeae TaxID=1538023 RepID=UPI00234FC761|nr:anhydro-N-acetylmuramic acid kinase [Aureisphaera galaxeae]MDC8005662.1 anhydro-N-acetylmuramic acid kinase [Aureisphaera galaxeae]